MCVHVRAGVFQCPRCIHKSVCARVSDWPGTGRFKTIRLVNTSKEPVCPRVELI